MTYATAWATEKRPGFVEFKQWTQRYAQADAKSRPALLAQGVALAKARRELLALLIKSAPRDALDSAVPAAVPAQLPLEVQAQLETRVSGRGDFLPVAIELPPGHQPAPERIRVKLAGKAYETFVYARRRSEAGKYNVPLHGIALDGLLALHESPLRVPEPGELPPRVKLAGSNQMVSVKPAGRGGQTQTDAGRKVVLADYAGEILAFPDPADVGHLEQALIRAENILGPHTHRIDLPPDGLPNLREMIFLNFGTTGWTTGHKNVLVIRVDFSDLPGEPHPLSELNRLITTYAEPFFHDMSYGRTTMTTTVTPTVYRMSQTAAFYRTGIPAPMGDEPAWVLHDDAQNAAAANYRLADYDRIVVLSAPIFPYYGVTQVGTPRVYLGGFLNTKLYTHELGHTYGLWHANLWQVTDGNPISRNGSSLGYGDPYDDMADDAAGDPLPRYHFNPWTKSVLGWLPESAIATVVMRNDLYPLYHFDDATADLTRPLALRIFRDGTRTYWISYRHNLAGHPALDKGAYVIWGYNFHSYQQSHLLDLTTPGSNALDAPLAHSAQFTDPLHNVDIRNLGDAGTGADEHLNLRISESASPGFVAYWGLGTLGTGMPMPPDIAGGVIDLAAGPGHALALGADGKVVAWGSPNSYGEATVPAGLMDVTAVAAGTYYSLVLKQDGTVFGWGDNTWGQLSPPAGVSDVVAIATGDSRSVALRSGGTVAQWGRTLGDGFPMPAGLGNVFAIAAGSYHALALKNDGTVVAWGDDARWPTDVSGPVDVPAGLHDVTAIAAGAYHSLALRSDGTVVAWGSNTFGQSDVPAGLHDVVTIGAGMYHSLARQADGTLVAWGDNSHWACDVPVGAPHILELAGGLGYSLALVGTPATLSLGNLTQTYDGTPRTVSVTTSPTGMSVRVLYNGSILPPTNAGTYAVEAAFVDPHYPARAHGTLTIMPVLLTARADFKSRPFGSLNPPFTISYTGFVHAETPAVLISPPVASTVANTRSRPGKYEISLSGGSAQNYTFNLIPGTLEVR